MQFVLYGNDCLGMAARETSLSKAGKPIGRKGDLMVIRHIPGLSGLKQYFRDS
jgi:hypothetical protein